MIYRDIHASLMRFCQEFTEVFLQGNDTQFVNFDATWEEAELPDSDLMGYFALTYEINDQIVEGSFQVGYSTREDTNLFRLVKAIDVIANALKPSSKIVIYDADTGTAKGFLIAKNGTRVLPVAGTKARPTQFIAVSFITTTTYELTSEVWSSVLP